MKRSHITAHALWLTAVATIWVAVVLYPAQRAAVPARAAEKVAPSGERAQQLGPLPRDRWELGERRTYAADIQTSLRSDDGTETREMRLDGSFEIALTAYDKRPGQTLVRVDLRPKQVTQSGQQKQQALTAQLRAQFREPLAITLDDRGKVKELYWEPQADLNGLGFLLGIVSGLQFVAPEAGTARSWSVDETDSNGRYTAEYSRTGPSSVEKRKQNFKRPSAGAGVEVVETSRITASVSYELGPQGVPVKVNGRQLSELKISERAMRTSSLLTLSLISIDKIVAEPVALAGKRSTTLAANDVAPPLSREHYEERARGHTVESTLNALRVLRPDQSDERRELMSVLEAVLRVQGSAAVAEAARAVRSMDRDEDATLVMGALHDSETPEAQQALIELARDKQLAIGRRDTALVDMGLYQKPTADALNGLRAMSEDTTLEPELRDTALLAMGGAARSADAETLAESHTVDYLTQRLEDARTNKDRMLVLDALGNTGSERVIDPMKQALQSDDASIRETAANGLRHVPGSDADALLSRAAATDLSPSVRSRAVASLAYRKLDDETRATLLNSVAMDKDVGVRFAALDVMAKFIEDDETLARAVSQASENDPDERVRSRATAILTGGSPSGGETASATASGAPEDSSAAPTSAEPTPRVATTHGTPVSAPGG